MRTVKATSYFHKGKVYIKPEEGTYEMVYRAACGVYWDADEKAIYLRDDPSNLEQSIKQISFALKNEYDINIEIYDSK